MRVVIVGGGAIGLMTAYHLAREGAEVVLADARQTGRGAAEVNAGWYCPGEAAPVPGPGMIGQSLKWMLHSDSPLYIRPSVEPEFLQFMLGMWRACTGAHQRQGYIASVRLAQSATHGYDEYRAEGIDFELRSDGLLLAFINPENLAHHCQDLDVAKGFGLEPEVLVGDAVREREPLLTDRVHGGLWFPHERHVDPNALMRSLHAKIEELGVTIVEDAPLRGVSTSGGRITGLQVGDQTVTGDEYVLATGAWTGSVARRFGLVIPVRPGKGYSIDLPPMGLSTCTNLSDAKVAVTPLATRLRVAGTMEFGRLEEGPNEVRIGAIVRAPESYLRGYQRPEPGSFQPRAGLRPMTPDGLPIIGRVAGYDNLTVSAGHGMMGITFGPGSAEAVTDLLLRDRVNPVLEPFSPRRFRIRRHRPTPLSRLARR